MLFCQGAKADLRAALEPAGTWLIPRAGVVAVTAAAVSNGQGGQQLPCDLQVLVSCAGDAGVGCGMRDVQQRWLEHNRGAVEGGESVL